MCSPDVQLVLSHTAARDFSPPLPPYSKFTEKAKIALLGHPCGMMTVLSPSTVAMSMFRPDQIEICDWKEGKHVRTLAGSTNPGSTNYVVANAVLPDGRLIAGVFKPQTIHGTIRIGLPDAWAASIIKASHGITGVLVGRDGSFVTTDRDSKVKLWREGECEVTLSGCHTDIYYGVPLAVIGHRLVVVGNKNNLLVSE